MTKKKFSLLQKTSPDPIYVSVSDQEIGLRLDCWILTKLKNPVSRNYIQRIIAKGYIKVNDVCMQKNNYLTKKEDIVSIFLEAEDIYEPKPENIPLDILFTDQHLMVINKPSGLVVHPGAGNYAGTLVHSLLYHCHDDLFQDKTDRPGIVHRLDKNTSGVMLIARTHLSYKFFKQSFAERQNIKRIYKALVWNIPQKLSGTINAPLGRAKNRTKRAVVDASAKDARQAMTHFKVLQKFCLDPSKNLNAALVECSLETGRTHQIRVHMEHIGHPIIGDPEYGKGFFSKKDITPEPIKTLLKNFSRQALHASEIYFQHPESMSMMRFEAPIPTDMQDLLYTLEKYQIK